jgi:hypothetical protein
MVAQAVPLPDAGGEGAAAEDEIPDPQSGVVRVGIGHRGRAELASVSDFDPDETVKAVSHEQERLRLDRALWWRRRVDSSGSPANSPRSRSEPITPPICLSNSTGTPFIR